MRKKTLKMEIWAIDKNGNRELVEETMTSADHFFDQFPVHKSKLKTYRKQNSLIVEEVDESKDKTLQAIITDSRAEENEFPYALKALADVLSN